MAKREILKDLAEIKKKIDSTTPSRAPYCKYEWGEMFDLKLDINRELLNDDPEVAAALKATEEAFSKLFEYHASNFAKVQK